MVSVVLKECLYCGQIGEKAELPVYWVRKEGVKPCDWGFVIGDL